MVRRKPAAGTGTAQRGPPGPSPGFRLAVDDNQTFLIDTCFAKFINKNVGVGVMFREFAIYRIPFSKC